MTPPNKNVLVVNVLFWVVAALLHPIASLLPDRDRRAAEDFLSVDTARVRGTRVRIHGHDRSGAGAEGSVIQTGTGAWAASPWRSRRTYPH